MLLGAVAIPARHVAIAAPAAAKAHVVLLADGMAGKKPSSAEPPTATFEAGEQVSLTAHGTHVAKGEGIIIVNTQTKEDVGSCLAGEKQCATAVTGKDGEIVVYRAIVVEVVDLPNGPIPTGYVTKSNRVRVQWKSLPMTLGADYSQSDPVGVEGVHVGDAGIWNAGDRVALHAAVPDGIGSNWASIVMTGRTLDQEKPNATPCNPDAPAADCATIGKCSPPGAGVGCTVDTAAYLDPPLFSIKDRIVWAFVFDATGHVLAQSYQLIVSWEARRVALRVTGPDAAAQAWQSSTALTVAPGEKVTIQAWLGNSGDEGYQPLRPGETLGLYDFNTQKPLACTTVDLAPPESGPACEATVSGHAGDSDSYSAVRQVSQGTTGATLPKNTATIKWVGSSPCGPTTPLAHATARQSEKAICLFVDGQPASSKTVSLGTSVKISAETADTLNASQHVEITRQVRGKADEALTPDCSTDDTGVTTCEITERYTTPAKVSYRAQIVTAGSPLATESSPAGVIWQPRGWAFDPLQIVQTYTTTLCADDQNGDCAPHQFTTTTESLSGKACGGDPATATWQLTETSATQGRKHDPSYSTTHGPAVFWHQPFPFGANGSYSTSDASSGLVQLFGGYGNPPNQVTVSMDTSTATPTLHIDATVGQPTIQWDTGPMETDQESPTAFHLVAPLKPLDSGICFSGCP
jgi:hypothetical protein